jgi:hypothetical protein
MPSSKPASCFAKKAESTATLRSKSSEGGDGASQLLCPLATARASNSRLVR